MVFDNALLHEALTLLRNKGHITADEEINCASRMETGNYSENTLTIAVPSKFYRDRFSERYQIKIEQELSEIEGFPIAIQFIVKERKAAEETVNEHGPAEIKTSEPPPQKNILSRDYRFETFVMGENNRFAYNAALAIAQNPGQVYNPCLIYGGVGLGKTHLLQAIGNYVYAKNSSVKIIYITAEKLYLEYAMHIQDNKVHAFKEKYRNVDLLLIDDIQFLQKKKGTQDELFHTFNELYETKKAIIFTSDSPVNALKDLSERMRSRFERGLKVDMQPPDFETKIAIINKKLEISGKKFPSGVAEAIAKAVQTNVRDLESAIMNIHAYAELTGKAVTPELANERLRANVASGAMPQLNISASRVMRIVSDYFNISVKDLQGKKKTKSIVYPRHLAMYILRQITEFSTTEIGLEFGGRDHTTVMHACQKIEDLKVTDPGLESTIHNLIRAIKENEEAN